MDQKNGASGPKSDQKVLLSVENGKVVVSGQRSEGKSGAVIRPGKGVAITVNGRQVTEKEEVFPGDQVELKAIEDLKPDQVEIKLSADEMKAEARYIPGVKKTHIIMDHPHSDNLVVEGRLFEEEISTTGIEDILKIIKAEKIVYGIDETIFPRLIEEKEIWQTVASGDPVQQGSDGRVESLLHGGVKSVTYDDQEGRVDFRKRFEIEQVAEGDVIAIIHPPVPGLPGKRVTGAEVQPDPVKRVEVNCESGTELNADKSQVVATRKGLPSYKKGRMHSFRVDDVYTQKGDVDIKSGNVYFQGHFKLHGGVAEGMKVAADGDIEIGENASGAEILAGGSIIFKNNCIKCRVQAGWVDIMLKDVYATIDQMFDSLNNALEACDEVAKALEAKGKHTEQMEAAVVRALLQSKFTDLPEYAATLVKLLRDVGKSLPENLIAVIKDIAPHFIDFQYSQSLDRPTLRDIRNKLSALQGGRETRVVPADITAPYIQNSILTCTGDIIIPGPGAYNSQMKCNGEVRIARLFRGGSVEAGGDVFVGEAGSPRITADQGLIQVPYKGRVHLGAVYENIRVRFGGTEYRVDKTYNNVRLVLDQQEFEVKILHWDK
jgi:uncharacterized protein